MTVSFPLYNRKFDLRQLLGSRTITDIGIKGPGKKCLRVINMAFGHGICHYYGNKLKPFPFGIAYQAVAGLKGPAGF